MLGTIVGRSNQYVDLQCNIMIVHPIQYIYTISTHTYSGLSNKRTLCVYLFPRKILPCAALFHSNEQYYNSPVRLFIFGKIPCPVRLFHTVRLLDSPEYQYCLTCLQTHREHHYSGILVDFAIQLMTLLENINQDSFQRFRLRAGLNKVWYFVKVHIF